MPVNQTLATYSDWTYGAAVAVYLLAMVFSLAQQAMTRTRAVVAQAVPVPALATVGAPAAELPPSRPTEIVVQQSLQSARAERFGRVGLSLTSLGALMHLAALTLRGLAVGRVP